MWPYSATSPDQVELRSRPAGGVGSDAALERSAATTPPAHATETVAELTGTARTHLVAACGEVHTPALVVARGPDHLTPRQTQIAHLAASGLGNRDIADRLGLSGRTVENQLQRVYDTTGLRRDDLADVS